MRSRLNVDPTLIKDREFWYEAEYYIMEDAGMNKMNASSGHHDDIIMATAIAMYVSDSFQSKQQKVMVKNRDSGGNFLVNLVNKDRKKRKNPIRKGMYRNNA